MIAYVVRISATQSGGTVSKDKPYIMNPGAKKFLGCTASYGGLPSITYVRKVISESIV
jgi:hypothetical protein